MYFTYVRISKGPSEKSYISQTDYKLVNNELFPNEINPDKPPERKKKKRKKNERKGKVERKEKESTNKRNMAPCIILVSFLVTIRFDRPDRQSATFLKKKKRGCLRIAVEISKSRKSKSISWPGIKFCMISICYGRYGGGGGAGERS